jgi:murein DD-endopeptidase MepM/ murein hydrolase activator NlpD
MKALRSHVLVSLLVLGLAPGPASAGPGSLDVDPVGVWPLRPTPEVVHDFDPPDDPWGSGHRGVDLAGRVGQPVHNALPGTVAFVGHIAGKPVVTISHGETRTTYEPVSSTIEVGARVAAGARIGSLELPFSHCFPSACLHCRFTVRTGQGRLSPVRELEPTTLRCRPECAARRHELTTSAGRMALELGKR